MNTELINMIGPALRGLLADNSEILKLVSFSSETGKPAKALTVEIPKDLAVPAVIDVLRKALADYSKTHGAKPTTVIVPSVGTFTVADSPALCLGTCSWMPVHGAVAPGAMGPAQ